MLKFIFLIVISTVLASTYGAQTIDASSNITEKIENGRIPVEPTPLPSSTLEPTTIKPTVAPVTKPTAAPTTSAPVTKPTTEAPTTVAPTTKPTTVAPDTKPTTPAPTVAPTTKPTTAPTTAAPTTVAPTVPTTVIPPTPQPKPVAPDTGLWQVNYTKTDTICILAKMALQIEIPYMTKENKTEHGYVDVPKNATSTGYCNETHQNITIDWHSGNVSIGFLLVNGSYGIDKFQIMVTPDPAHFPNMKDNSTQTLVHNKEEFKVIHAKSYKCDKLETLNLTSIASNSTIAFIHVSNLQVQAFHNTTSTGFTDAVNCEPLETPDIVPIAVGCALAALVIIVLVAYLIGRRRSQARGYLSM